MSRGQDRRKNGLTSVEIDKWRREWRYEPTLLFWVEMIPSKSHFRSLSLRQVIIWRWMLQSILLLKSTHGSSLEPWCFRKQFSDNSSYFFLHTTLKCTLSLKLISWFCSTLCLPFLLLVFHWNLSFCFVQTAVLIVGYIDKCDRVFVFKEWLLESVVNCCYQWWLTWYRCHGVKIIR